MLLLPPALTGIHLLITSFDPFGGSPTNNSQAIAAVLNREASALGADVTVQVCNLPVVYDQAAKVAENCIEKDHPDVVISLGEAACELRLETAASNWDDTPGLPDNAGVIRSGSEILPGGPRRVAFEFPVESMACSADALTQPVQISISPGAYVCNNLAYHLAHHLSPRGIPYTFIHVPNAYCSADQKDPEGNAKAIEAMLRPVLAEIHAGTRFQLMPSTQSEAATYLQQLESQHAPACEIQFAQKLVSDYQNP